MFLGKKSRFFLKIPENFPDFLECDKIVHQTFTETSWTSFDKSIIMRRYEK